MKRLVAGRILAAVGTLLAVQVLLILLFSLAPGSAADLVATGAARDTLAASWGETDPWPFRLARRVWALLTLDPGTSRTLRPGAPVSELLRGPLLRSAGIVLASVALSTATALAFARRAERGAGTWIVRLPSLLPHFVAAHLLVAALNGAAWTFIDAGLVERPGWFPLPLEPSALRWTLAVCVVSWTSGALSEGTELLLDAIVTLRRSPFVDALRARGEPVEPVLRRHMWPVIADIAARRVPATFGALVFVDPLLQLGGVGLLLWRAAEERDLDVAFGAVTAIAVAVAAARVLADLVALWVDPRRRAVSWP